MTDPRMTPTNDAPVTVEQIAARLVDQSDEPWPQGTTADRLHYWRDKAIDCSNRLAALASAPVGDGVADGEPAPWAIAAERAATDAYAQHMGLPEESDPTAGQRAAALAIERHATAALARPRAAVGERTAILAAVLRYDHDRANIMGVGSGSFHKVRNDFVDAILALQSPPAKVEGE